MFIGGTLIRRYDGFRRLCRRAAVEFSHPLTLPDADLLLTNRVLAALGGPPALPEVRGRFEGDGLALLLLFLLTQEFPCRAGLVGETDAPLARLKGLVHVFGHAVYPMVSGEPPLAFQAIVRELGPSGAILKPCVRYDAAGEPTEIEPGGAAGILGVGREAGPYTLAVITEPGGGPVPLGRLGELHATALVLTRA